MAIKRRDQQGERNPLFNLARGYSALTNTPPFSFDNVMLHFFPLRADFDTLENFVDSTINLAPDFAYFRPIAPLVLMISAHYPKMSMEEGNLGWTAQNELLFTIPVEWYQPKGKEYNFKALAQYAPFVFVSDEASQVEGREVFGWPKVQGWLEPTLNSWVHNPSSPRELLNLKTHVFEHLYRNDPYQAETVLQIFQQAPSSFSIMPPSIENPLNPLKSLPTIIEDLSANMRSLWDWGFNQTLRDPRSLPTTLLNVLDGMTETVNSMSGNTINLKQLRDAQNPQLACYQAITNARMKVANFNKSGMLGDTVQLTGDLSGGYSIGISRFPSLPIIESLGLVVDGQDIGENDAAISYLKPVLPFWQDLDMVYSKGENIAWRAAECKGSRWRNRKYVQKMKDHTGGKTANGQKISKPDDRLATELDPHLPYYVTEGSAGFQVAEGPFNFPDATYRVLPLLADIEKLRAYLEGSNLDGSASADSLFGQVPDKHICFEPAEPKVYLTIATYGEMTAKRNNMGLWAETQVKFLIPVRVSRRIKGKRQPLGMGLVSAFDFSNSALGTTTSRELNGWPTVLSEIDNLPNTWGEADGPFASAAPLIRVKTSMPTALHTDQPFTWNTLLEVVNGRLVHWNNKRAWRQVAKVAGQPLKDDVTRMANTVQGDPEGFEAFQSLALQVFSGEREVHEYSFKQFRDADAPQEACYQSVVKNRATFRIKDLRPLAEHTNVRIYDFPTQPIVQTLGLVHFGTEPNDNAPTFRLMSCRPFFFKAHLTTRLGEVVCWRAGNRKWRSLTKPRKIRDDVPGHDFVRFINTGVSKLPKEKKNNAPQNIDMKLKEWCDDAQPEDFLSRKEIQSALSGKFEPHMVLHSALSHEWEHCGAPRWYQEVERRNDIEELKDAKSKTEAQAQVGSPKSTPLGKLNLRRADLIDIGKEVDRAVDLDQQHGTNLEPTENDEYIRQLPTFVIATDCVGPEEDRLFPIEERVQGEHEPEYWTPPSRLEDGESH